MNGIYIYFNGIQNGMIQWDWDTSSWCIRCMLGSRSSNAESFAKSGRWYSLTNTNTLGALLITPSFSHQRLLWSRLKSMGEWQHVKCWLQFHECFMLICHSHYLLSFNVSHSQYFHWPCHALDRKVISLHISTIWLSVRLGNLPVIPSDTVHWWSSQPLVLSGLGDNKPFIRCQTTNCSKQQLIAVA